jgi:hypothetical protein
VRLLIGNMGTFRGKPRRNGRACGRQYLHSAICAFRTGSAKLSRMTLSCSQRVRFVLNAKGIPFEEIKLDLLDAENTASSARRWR